MDLWRRFVQVASLGTKTAYIPEEIYYATHEEEIKRQKWFILARLSQLDPEFFGGKWWYSGRDVILAALRLLKYTKWGRTYGKAILSWLLSGFVDIRFEKWTFSSIHQKSVIYEIDPTTIYINPYFRWNAPVEYIALILAHEGAHAYYGAYEASAWLFEAALYTELKERYMGESLWKDFWSDPRGRFWDITMESFIYWYRREGIRGILYFLMDKYKITKIFPPWVLYFILFEGYRR